MWTGLRRRRHQHNRAVQATPGLTLAAVCDMSPDRVAAALEVAPDAVRTRPKGGVEALEALASREDTNVLFILVDTLRAERMSAYGYARDTTPFLSKLSSTSIRLGKNIAQSSWTKASMASMWSRSGWALTISRPPTRFS